MRNLLIIVYFVWLAGINASCQKTSENEPNNQDMNTTNLDIKIKCGSQVFEAVLWNNPTSLSLVSQMPFTIKLEDYGGVEKIFYPVEALNKENAPAGAKPEIGDIMCYGPWGNVVLFYGDFGYAKGLIPMGNIGNISDLIEALSSENNTITIEK